MRVWRRPRGPARADCGTRRSVGAAYPRHDRTHRRATPRATPMTRRCARASSCCRRRPRRAEPGLERRCSDPKVYISSFRTSKIAASGRRLQRRSRARTEYLLVVDSRVDADPVREGSCAADFGLPPRARAPYPVPSSRRVSRYFAVRALRETLLEGVACAGSPPEGEQGMGRPRMTASCRRGAAEPLVRARRWPTISPLEEEPATCA